MSKNLTVLFNASVILAGLKSPKGSSAKLISWVQQAKIKGIISEIILDEAERNLEKLSLNKKALNKLSSFKVKPAPNAPSVKNYAEIVVYLGDAHVLASAKEAKADYLVSLDKRRILVLKSRFKKIKIVSPGELIKSLS